MSNSCWRKIHLESDWTLVHVQGPTYTVAKLNVLLSLLCLLNTVVSKATLLWRTFAALMPKITPLSQLLFNFFYHEHIDSEPHVSRWLVSAALHVTYIQWGQVIYWHGVQYPYAHDTQSYMASFNWISDTIGLLTQCLEILWGRTGFQ